jgi:hypothetical protein
MCECVYLCVRTCVSGKERKRERKKECFQSAVTETQLLQKRATVIGANYEATCADFTMGLEGPSLNTT